MEFGAKVPPPPQAPDHTFERAEVGKEWGYDGWTGAVDGLSVTVVTSK